ncbi:unnamed protein product [Schistocephalus solidus]|uniref:PDEase domain-containing protein n=1 Tax=Schistocephalus solidus TaxID=70667 RepID=A0A183TSV8_SCHSO|nr:unnamed protein product [Schistocephalus solidus]
MRSTLCPKPPTCFYVPNQNNVQSRLSICYNTNSPLENHHCAVAFDLVRTPETNIFKGLSDSDANLAKLLSLRCILGTDMGKHTDILQAYTAKLASLGLPTTASSSDCAHTVPSADVAGAEYEATTVVDTATRSRRSPTCDELAKIFAEDEEARALTMVMLLKMCDISTEIRPAATCGNLLKLVSFMRIIVCLSPMGYQMLSLPCASHKASCLPIGLQALPI